MLRTLDCEHTQSNISTTETLLWSIQYIMTQIVNSTTFISKFIDIFRYRIRSLYEGDIFTAYSVAKSNGIYYFIPFR